MRKNAPGSHITPPTLHAPASSSKAKRLRSGSPPPQAPARFCHGAHPLHCGCPAPPAAPRDAHHVCFPSRRARRFLRARSASAAIRAGRGFFPPGARRAVGRGISVGSRWRPWKRTFEGKEALGRLGEGGSEPESFSSVGWEMH